MKNIDFEAARRRMVDGQIAARDRITLTLTVDHNVLDGAPAARFIARLRRRIADPSALGLPTTNEAA